MYCFTEMSSFIILHMLLETKATKDSYSSWQVNTFVMQYIKREVFAGRHNFESFLFYILELFLRLKWHLIYQNWLRHLSFTTEKGLKILIILLLFSECFHLSKKAQSLNFPLWHAAWHSCHLQFSTWYTHLRSETYQLILVGINFFRDCFKTQPPVDPRFCPVPVGFYSSKQWQPPGTGRNRRSTGGWILKPSLSLFIITFHILRLFIFFFKNTLRTIYPSLRNLRRAVWKVITILWFTK